MYETRSLFSWSKREGLPFIWSDHSLFVSRVCFFLFYWSEGEKTCASAWATEKKARHGWSGRRRWDKLPEKQKQRTTTDCLLSCVTRKFMEMRDSCFPFPFPFLTLHDEQGTKVTENVKTDLHLLFIFKNELSFPVSNNSWLVFSSLFVKKRKDCRLLHFAQRFYDSLPFLECLTSSSLLFISPFPLTTRVRLKVKKVVKNKSPARGEQITMKRDPLSLFFSSGSVSSDEGGEGSKSLVVKGEEEMNFLLSLQPFLLLHDIENIWKRITVEERVKNKGLSHLYMCLSRARSSHESFTLLLSLVLSQPRLERSLWLSIKGTVVEVTGKREERREAEKRKFGRQRKAVEEDLSLSFLILRIWSCLCSFVVRTEAAGISSQRTENETGIRTREGMNKRKRGKGIKVLTFPFLTIEVTSIRVWMRKETPSRDTKKIFLLHRETGENNVSQQSMNQPSLLDRQDEKGHSFNGRWRESKREESTWKKRWGSSDARGKNKKRPDRNASDGEKTWRNPGPSPEGEERNEWDTTEWEGG